MPMEDHLKIAATELRKAAELVKQEIDALRGEEINLRSMIEKETAGILTQVSLYEAELNNPNIVDNSQITSTIRNLQLQVARRKRDLDNQRKRINDIVKAKESQISWLEAQMRSIMP